MTQCASAEIAELPRSFARLQWHGTDAAVGYVTADGRLAVGAWRFAAPGSAGAARTVLAAKAGTEQPTQVRIATVMPLNDSDDNPLTLVTLSRVAAGTLSLASRRLHKTLVYQRWARIRSGSRRSASRRRAVLGVGSTSVHSSA